MYILKELLKRKLALLGLLIITVIVLAAVFAPWVAPYSPEDQMSNGLTDIGEPLAPNSQFWLGTDLLGRDLLSRLIFGARTSLIIGLLANGIAILIGAMVGVTAGFLRGWIGGILMRFTDLMMAFPSLILGIVLAALIGPSLWNVTIVIALVNWVQIARVLYTETTSLAEREYIMAERSIGAGTARILIKHMLPHLLPTITVWATLGIATTVLLEAALSFLGQGVQPPTPSWGGMINENQSYFQSFPWLVFFPGIVIAALALSFNLLGNALRDILDPTLRGRH
jgi:peptide/nickel transport system permease protein